MKITATDLSKKEACEEGIADYIHNKLYLIDWDEVERIDVEDNNILWLIDRFKLNINMMGTIKRHDDKGNIIYYKNPDGYEEWKEYDENGNLTHSKNSNGYECWKEYDKNGNLTHSKNSDGYECWYEYDGNNLINVIIKDYTPKEYDLSLIKFKGQ